MTDVDGTTRPNLRRADLRRMREALDHAKPATILTVCTGNICRSPMGEVLLRASLRDLDVRVHSGGTHALVDHGMTEQAQQLAVVNGADAGESAAHRARLLNEGLLAESDLVLTMAREHRSQVVQLAPAMLHRTFTVREFGRLAATLTDDDVRRGVASAGSDAGTRVQALARLVGGQRGMVPAAPDDDDVIDPYRRSQTTYELSTSQLVPAVAESTRVIRAALG
ncbi:low molecular weight phosphatase family protein [Microbacterium sp. H1-D42]|uniref:arsenate reductase/protein-tyrosine-phosphatase family protein n=1 Tax=Microbacterium sp. H1-D42 TaxID=2925844 RepID=UPI001F535235|nr:low molecular weight phosphatase family protein [Microbacterium sp. H1-D42]UNK70109.1 low molecular weight phosphatase family protein [Microbacterium sp. H1-D42]